MRQSGKLYGMLVMALCLAAATAISLACLGKASDMSHAAYAQDAGLPYVQSAADAAMRDHGTDGLAPDGAIGYFDRDMHPCDKNSARYVIHIRYGTDDGHFYEGRAELSDLRDGTVLIGLPIAWADEDAIRKEALE